MLPSKMTTTFKREYLFSFIYQDKTIDCFEGDIVYYIVNNKLFSTPAFYVKNLKSKIYPNKEEAEKHLLDDLNYKYFEKRKKQIELRCKLDEIDLEIEQFCFSFNKLDLNSSHCFIYIYNDYSNNIPKDSKLIDSGAPIFLKIVIKESLLSNTSFMMGLETLINEWCETHKKLQNT